MMTMGFTPMTAVPLRRGKPGLRDTDTQRRTSYEYTQTQGDHHCSRD